RSQQGDLLFCRIRRRLFSVRSTGSGSPERGWMPGKNSWRKLPAQVPTGCLFTACTSTMGHGATSALRPFWMNMASDGLGLTMHLLQKPSRLPQKRLKKPCNTQQLLPISGSEKQKSKRLPPTAAFWETMGKLALYVSAKVPTRPRKLHRKVSLTPG